MNGKITVSISSRQDKIQETLGIEKRHPKVKWVNPSERVREPNNSNKIPNFLIYYFSLKP